MIFNRKIVKLLCIQLWNFYIVNKIMIFVELYFIFYIYGYVVLGEKVNFQIIIIVYFYFKVCMCLYMCKYMFLILQEIFKKIEIKCLKLVVLEKQDSELRGD